MKKALLVGSNGFLGAYWAEILHENNFETYGISVGENCEPVKKENFTYYDVSSVEWKNFIFEYLLKLKPEVIVYNAGIDSPPGKGSSQLMDFDIEGWRKIFEVNLFAAVSLLNAISAINDFKPRVVVIGSQYATLSPNKNLYSHMNDGEGSIKHPGYSSSKFALKAVVKQYASELAAKGILINMLSPGAIANSQDSEFVRKFSERNPIPRLGKRTELGSALQFLLDEKNTYCVGVDLLIDGGYSVW